MEREYSITGPNSKLLRHVETPPDYVFLMRIDLGLMAVLAELRACNHWGSIEAEYLDGAPALTEMGQADDAFFGSSASPAGRG